MNVAVIGCGAIAQVMHLPNVVQHPNLQLHALVDPDDHRLETIGGHFGVQHRFLGVEQLLDEAQRDLDAAIVCTPMHTHADTAVPVLEAGIHVLLEKPIAMTMSHADDLVEAAEATPATTMIGYMKRYARAYERTAAAVRDLSSIDLISVYDTDGDYQHTLEETYDLVDHDLSDTVVEQSRVERKRQAKEAIGTEDADLADAYDFQLEHVCHDVNALRGLFGNVSRIHHVDLFADGRYGTAFLEYQNQHRAVLKSGVGDRLWFDQRIRVDAPEGMVTLEFGNPFIRNDVPRVRIRSGAHARSDSTEQPTSRDSFKQELDHFVRCIDGDEDVRTTFREARKDLKLVIDLFRAYQDEASPMMERTPSDNGGA